MKGNLNSFLTAARLFQDVLRWPSEDGPRLAYAKHLETVGGYENSARAEFIQVQCDLAKQRRGRDFSPSPLNDEFQSALENREYQLLMSQCAGDKQFTLWSDWCWTECRLKDGTPCKEGEKHEGGMIMHPNGPATWSPKFGSSAPSINATVGVPSFSGMVTQQFTRGFVSYFLAPLEFYIGGRCGECRNSNSNRFFKQYSADVKSAEYCFRCTGTRFVPSPFETIIREYPIEWVYVSSHQPLKLNNWEYIWGCGSDTTHSLPREIYEALIGDEIVIQGSPPDARVKRYFTSNDAHNNLSRAIINVTRSKNANQDRQGRYGRSYSTQCSSWAPARF